MSNKRESRRKSSVNIEAIRRVRKAIEAAPPERFEYFNVFTDTVEAARLMRQGYDRHRALDRALIGPHTIDNFHDLRNNCGTAACVAGWTAMVEDVQFTSVCETVCDAAERVLGLTGADAHELFYGACGVATRKDALARLLWLQNYCTLENYDWTREEGYAIDPSLYGGLG